MLLKLKTALGASLVAVLMWGTTAANAATVVGGSTTLSSTTANQLETWLNEGPINLTNIFTKSNGDSSSDFHAAVDGQGATFTVIELANGNVIGGYNPNSWNSSGGYIRESVTTAFLFNLTTTTKYDAHTDTWDPHYVTYNSSGHGSTFGGGHDLYINSSLEIGYANIGYSYGDYAQRGEASYQNAFIGATNRSVVGYEVFTVSPGSVSQVPLPAALPLLIIALGGLGMASRRRKAA